MSDVDVERTEQLGERVARQMPRPSGYKVLCTVPVIEATFGDSGILKPDLTMTAEQHATVVLFVISLGPDAYKDTTKFPGGAWCKPGDFIITRAYAGTRLKIHGHELRIINDDSVEAVIEDPRGVSRAG